MYPHRPTYADIDLGALRHNYDLLRQRLPAHCFVLGVVKADAYGHGAVPVARVLQARGADMLAVAIVEEGLELRQAGIDAPVLLLGGSAPGQEAVIVEQDLDVVVFEPAQIERLDSAAAGLNKVCRCHLKVDSGMGRIGVLPSGLSAILELLKRCTSLELVGVMTHFAVADSPHNPYTVKQLERFAACVRQVRGAGFEPHYIHAANSAASFDTSLHAVEFDPECGCNLARAGIALYGGQPFCAGADGGKALPLRPVMNLRTAIAYLRHLPADSSVSYGRRFTTERPALIAAIPVGYADGYNRKLTNVGTALVRGQRVEVAGTVCMDWTMLDVTDVADVQPGDEVTLLGCAGDDCITAEEWARKVGTISYEVFCNISKRVPRYYGD